MQLDREIQLNQGSETEMTDSSQAPKRAGKIEIYLFTSAGDRVALDAQLPDDIDARVALGRHIGGGCGMLPCVISRAGRAALQAYLTQAGYPWAVICGS